jgi:hypothetical protein
MMVFKDTVSLPHSPPLLASPRVYKNRTKLSLVYAVIKESVPSEAPCKVYIR